MTKFEVGGKYEMRSACNHDCVWTYEVVKRTAKTVTFKDISRRWDNMQVTLVLRISKYSEMAGTETVFPLGRYSMCPVLRADRLAS